MLKHLCILLPALAVLPVSAGLAQDRQPISNKTCEELLAF